MHGFLNTAVKAAREAGKIIHQGFDRHDLVKVDIKAAKDFVTNIDKQAEEAIINILHEAYPKHGFIAEESGTSGDEEFQWIIDPLDGTANFVHGLPHCSVSIALKYKDRIQHGVIYDPVRDDLFTASRGDGAQLNNRRLRVSARKKISDCLLAGCIAPAAMNDEKIYDAYMNLFKILTREAVSVRRTGSAALDLAYIASGRLDGMFAFDMKIWDIAAGTLLIQEAGGLMTDEKGGEDYMETGYVVAANPQIFKELIRIVRKETADLYL